MKTERFLVLAAAITSFVALAACTSDSNSGSYNGSTDDNTEGDSVGSADQGNAGTPGVLHDA